MARARSTPRPSGIAATARPTSSRIRRFFDPDRADEFKDRNVILYGHSQSNAAWPVFWAKAQCRFGAVKSRSAGGRLRRRLCLPVHPASSRERPGFSRRRLRNRTDGPPLDGTASLLHFRRGLSRLPAAGGQDLGRGQPVPKAAGYFGPDWGVESGEFVWHEVKSDRNPAGSSRFRAFHRAG